METIILALIGLTIIIRIWYVNAQKSAPPADEKETLANIMHNLHLMDKSDPLKRKKNKHDLWFEHHIEEFCYYEKALTFINLYEHLSKRYISLLKNPQRNLELQRKLITIEQYSYLSSKVCKYEDLATLFLQRCDFAPEIKEIIANDDTFLPIRKLRHMWHK